MNLRSFAALESFLSASCIINFLFQLDLSFAFLHLKLRTAVLLQPFRSQLLLSSVAQYSALPQGPKILNYFSTYFGFSM